MKRRFAAYLAVLTLLGALWVGSDLYRSYRGYSANLFIVIEPGLRATAVAELLVQRGVLVHRGPFLLRYWLGRSRHTLKAGEYLFDRSLRPIDVYRKLIQGDVYLYSVVIPEGSDRFDISRILHERLGLNPAEFLRVTEQASMVRDLDPQASSLEGYLFPDTYRFARGVSPATVAITMVARFRRVLGSKFRGDFPSSSARLHGMITLASLVEKETPDPAERPLIAGVFARRLEMAMPLQCDPTVVYAARLNHRTIGTITESDLDFDSPYNTYRHAGLPPGPIANPGEASIRAALHPARGVSLYFVSNLHGGHFFAGTLAEHQRNVSRYRREVAVLRHGFSDNARALRRDSPAPHREGKGAASRATKSAKHRQQKTAHPRLLPGAESRSHRD